MSAEENVRELEDGIVTDLRGKLSYGGYLDLGELLSAQHPVSRPEHHDELLFIIQHQTTELWLKLVIHEIDSARRLLAQDDLASALKRLARVKHIEDVMTAQWSVLATLTPAEYLEFRDSLGTSSGFQSFQYRAVEFALGNKNAAILSVFADDAQATAMLQEELDRPTLYDEFLRHMARRGVAVPEQILNRDVREPYRFVPELVPVICDIYRNYSDQWSLYEACEDLVDLEEKFQLWRFRHLRTVMRTIGMRTGTGGSSGVDFLQRALQLTFFPELFAARAQL